VGGVVRMGKKGCGRRVRGRGMAGEEMRLNLFEPKHVWSHIYVGTAQLQLDGLQG